MEIVFGFGLLVAVAAIGFVSLPLLVESPKRSAEQATSSAEVDDLLAQKEATYAAIKELEFDHDTGNLSDADFEELREGQKSLAIALLKRIENAADNTASSKRRHESRTADPQKARTPVQAAQVKPQSKANSQLAARYCTKCGKKYQPGDRFCSGCGTQLP